MNISIVIPIINEASNVQRAIHRAWNAGADEVVIVDGGSTDGSVEIAEHENCVLIHSQPGRGVQLNAGADSASGDFLVFLHVDNWLVENACRQIGEAVTKKKARFGCFRQRIESSQSVYRWIETGNLWRAQHQGLVYGDQAMFIERNLFFESGRFPEIAIMEDFAFSKIARRRAKFFVLSGPTHVSPRRWEQNGPLRQTLTNWYLSLAFRCGASPEWIAERYRRHDNSE